MNKKMNKKNATFRYKNISIVFFCLIIFAGCSIKDTVKSVSDEEILRDRVMAYWNDKINQDFDKSYGYEHPLYRKQVNMANYIRGFNTEVVQWTAAKVEEIKMDGPSARVGLKITVKVRLPRIKTGEDDSWIKEDWRKVDDVWYHVPAMLGEGGKGM